MGATEVEHRERRRHPIGEEPGLDEQSIRLALHSLKASLRRLADRDVNRALAVQLHLLAGRRPAEIRAALGLTAIEYKAAAAWLREALSRDG